MGDGLKLIREKRHKSSSSLAGVVEGTRSERKLDVRASIPEVDDQFSIAETRCDDLQEKIDLLRILKRKKKMKKRSTTRVTESSPVENIPYISVRTQPKRNVQRQDGSRSRTPRGRRERTFMPINKRCGAVTSEYQNDITEQTRQQSAGRRTRADGDSSTGYARPGYSEEASQAVFCEKEDLLHKYLETGFCWIDERDMAPQIKKRPEPSARRPLNQSAKEAKQSVGDAKEGRQGLRRPRPTVAPVLQPSTSAARGERPVVELFHKRNISSDADQRRKLPSKNNEAGRLDETAAHPSGSLENSKPPENKAEKKVREARPRVRGYERPTVSSQMRSTTRQPPPAPSDKIPFIVSKITGPSYNIGLNIQQVLNGVKIQQPLCGIPPTIAHQMGLSHVPSYRVKSATESSERGINAIKVGHRVLRLELGSMSYDRLLRFCREGEGPASRYLRTHTQTNYASMFDLHRAETDGTSKHQGHLRQRLAEYASLYRQYERLGHAPALDHRRMRLASELAAREQFIRKVVQEYDNAPELSELRVSHSAADHSTYGNN